MLPWLIRAAAALVLLALAAAPARAQLTFPGASPVSSGNVIIRTQPEVTGGTNSFSGLFDKNVLIYGASPSVALIVQSNTFASTTLPVNVDGNRQRASAAGFGDTLIEARYTVYQQDGVGSTFRIAPYIGFSVPTGMDAANQQLPRGAQPGTGAWASRDALTASWQQLFWNGGAEIGYQTNATAAGYRYGNEFYADAGFHYLLWPRTLEGLVPAELYASIETNYAAVAASRASGRDVQGTAADLWLVDPGLIYTTPRYSMSLNAFLPVYERVSASASRFQYGLELLFRLSLFTEHHW